MLLGRIESWTNGIFFRVSIFADIGGWPELDYEVGDSSQTLCMVDHWIFSFIYLVIPDEFRVVQLEIMYVVG